MTILWDYAFQNMQDIDNDVTEIISDRFVPPLISPLHDDPIYSCTEVVTIIWIMRYWSQRHVDELEYCIHFLTHFLHQFRLCQVTIQTKSQPSVVQCSFWQLCYVKIFFLLLTRWETKKKLKGKCIKIGPKITEKSQTHSMGLAVIL